MSSRDPGHAEAEAVARRSYGRLVALVASRTRDLEAAEEALAEAFAAALSSWPTAGVPRSPEAWLLSAARRKAIDAARRQRTREAAGDHLALLSSLAAEGEAAPGIPDHRLALLLACAHPAIDEAIRAPLMLQVVLGLDARRVASAFLVSPATMGQRLARAKSKLRHAGIPFRIPGRAELAPRLSAVLEAIYAAFTAGMEEDPGELAAEALFLARVVSSLLPEEPEAQGLLALLLYVEARRPARRDPAGDYVPLAAQDPARWDHSMIAAAEALLRSASTRGQAGRFQIEAALQSAHVERRRSGRDNGPAVAQLYDALYALVPSPVVLLNRAIAIAEVEGTAAALASIAGLAGDPRMAAYQPYWAVRAELLSRAGDRAEARAAYELAIGLSRDPAVRRHLAARRG